MMEFKDLVNELTERYGERMVQLTELVVILLLVIKHIQAIM